MRIYVPIVTSQIGTASARGSFRSEVAPVFYTIQNFHNDTHLCSIQYTFNTTGLKSIGFIWLNSAWVNLSVRKWFHCKTKLYISVGNFCPATSSMSQDTIWSSSFIILSHIYSEIFNTQMGHGKGRVLWVKWECLKRSQEFCLLSSCFTSHSRSRSISSFPF